MSVPAPVREKVPPPKVAAPGMAGAPTSWEIHGAGRLPGALTVNVSPLLATLLTVTTTGPVVAPLGTATTMLLSLQFVGVASVPLNRTPLVLCVTPKFAPLIVTDVPTMPDVGKRPERLGGGATSVTVQVNVLLVARAPSDAVAVTE